MNRRVVVAANSSWNIVNFRAGLIRGLRDAGYEPIVVAPLEETDAARLAQLDVEHFDIAISRSGMNPIVDGALLLRYRKVLSRIAPAAFLGFTIKPNIYGALAARSLGIPVVANVSGLGTAFGRRGLLRTLVIALYRVGLRKARRVFFQNEDDLREFVDEEVIQSRQAGLLPGSGIDLKRFAAAPLPPGMPVFLLVARLLRGKGIYEYVEAARTLRDEFPEARFQLLGPVDKDNPTAISHEDLDRWITDGVVEYLGSTDDVRAAIGGATAIVLPSFYREGVPRSLLEGAAMARPLIATDMPGCRELVVNQRGGIACKPRDATSLTNVMRRLIEMPAEDRTKMGFAARKLVEEKFGEERVVEAYLHELKSIAPLP